MAVRMLIDATHAEETRVVVVQNKKLEEFDFETSTKKQLKGNIYLAKVTRVEPSLQAAFVDYGGTRDGFLPFSEIHPDYYQIPVADRVALLEQERAREAIRQAEEEAEPEVPIPAAAEATAATDDGEADLERDQGAPAESLPAVSVEETDLVAGVEDEADFEEAAEIEAPNVEPVVVEAPGPIEAVGGDDIDEDDRAARRRHRHYKIQEVIKRRQIILIQVVKEERGNKGAALTTYISLAGRYCVLMPNTPRGGGISRKIVSASDRKRLKDMVGSLDVPEGMGVIVRTAGMNRNKPEIKRDFEYLLRLWDEIRETTLSSTAPTLVHEEANLIKRAIRDLYTKEIEEIFVEGDAGYKAAKVFMKTLMPSRAKVVQPYKGDVPLFHKYGVEEQFDVLYSPQIQLKSGGYIVINPTEALVAIDVNSGRSTRERSIEDTALATNLEAAEEIARQLRLRDFSGLIVIDFIDMEVSRNNRQVERRLKECLKHDRARLQVGRISAFGLLEMSRQRLRPSIIEASSQPCKHCGGTGHVRSTESAALTLLRSLEDEGIRRRGGVLAVQVASPTALYLLNFKRSAIAEIEARYELRIFLHGNDDLVPPEFRLERRAGDEDEARKEPAAQRTPAKTGDRRDVDKPGEEEEGRKKRRRGRRRKKEQDERQAEVLPENAEDAAIEVAETAPTEAEADEERGDRKRRRRGKRGGRRRSRGAATALAGTEPQALELDVPPEASTAGEPVPEPDDAAGGEHEAATEPGEWATYVPDAATAHEEAPRDSEPEPEPERHSAGAADMGGDETADAALLVAAAEQVGQAHLGDEAGTSAKEPRRGWWRRPFS